MFPKSVKGLKMSDWDEIWFDIRRENPGYATLKSLMDKRVKALADKGCDAIEYDNLDVGLFPLTHIVQTYAHMSS